MDRTFGLRSGRILCTPVHSGAVGEWEVDPTAQTVETEPKLGTRGRLRSCTLFGLERSDSISGKGGRGLWWVRRWVGASVPVADEMHTRVHPSLPAPSQNNRAKEGDGVVTRTRFRLRLEWGRTPSSSLVTTSTRSHTFVCVFSFSSRGSLGKGPRTEKVRDVTGLQTHPGVTPDPGDSESFGEGDEKGVKFPRVTSTTEKFRLPSFPCSDEPSCS